MAVDASLEADRLADEQPLPDFFDTSRERLGRLPDAIWDCEACGQHGTMLIEASSFDDYAIDDVTLHCRACHYVRSHRVRFDPNEFDREAEKREYHYDSRTITYVHDAPDAVGMDEAKPFVDALRVF